jgi:hypothetical protein
MRQASRSLVSASGLQVVQDVCALRSRWQRGAIKSAGTFSRLVLSSSHLSFRTPSCHWQRSAPALCIVLKMRNPLRLHSCVSADVKKSIRYEMEMLPYLQRTHGTSRHWESLKGCMLRDFSAPLLTPWGFENPVRFVRNLKDKRRLMRSYTGY